MQYPVFNIHSFVVALGLALSSPYGFAKSFYVDLDFNAVSNSNVFLAADNENSKSVSDKQRQTSISFGFDFLENDRSDARVFIDYFSESFVDNEIDSQFISLSLPYSLYLADYRFKLTPAYMQYRTDDNSALGYLSTSFDISRKFERRYSNHFFGAGYKYTEKASLTTSFDGYAGNSHEVILTYSVRWDRRSLRTRFGSYANNYSNENNNLFSGTENEFSEDLIGSVLLGESKSHSGYYVDASYRFYSRKFSWAFSGRIKSYEYEANEFDDSVRKDTNYRIGGTLDYHLNKSIDLYARTEYTLNHSNMEATDSDRNYSQFINSLGIRFHF